MSLSSGPHLLRNAWSWPYPIGLDIKCLTTSELYEPKLSIFEVIPGQVFPEGLKTLKMDVLRIVQNYHFLGEYEGRPPFLFISKFL